MGGYLSANVRSTLLPAALLTVAVLVVYGPTLGYPFVYEDLNDEGLFLAAPSWETFEISARLAPGRTLTKATYVVNQWLFGAENPAGFHAFNVGLHLASVFLLWALARRVWAWPAALLAAGLFAVHPLQVEAVAYVSGRGDVVAACGVLLALWATSAGSVAGAGLGVVVAALGKETAIVAWGLVPLWATWTRAPFPVKRWLWTAAPALAIGVWVSQRMLVPVALDLPQITETATSIWRMVGLFWLPVGFTIDHDWQGVPLVWQAGAAGLSVGLTLYAVTFGWRRSWVALAWLWTVLALAPRFVVPVTEGLHEHHFYVPMIGWCLCAGGWLQETSAGRLEGTLRHGEI